LSDLRYVLRGLSLFLFLGLSDLFEQGLVKFELGNVIVPLLCVFEFEMQGVFFDLLIDEEISALAFSAPVLSSKAVILDIMGIELSDPFVVELNPPGVSLFDVAEVVAELCAAVVQDNSPESERVVIGVALSLLRVQRVVVYIKGVGELPAGVDLFVLELVVVEAHALQVDDEVVGHLRQQTAFGHVRLLLAGVALIV
jgi:hypothetical protein